MCFAILIALSLLACTSPEREIPVVKVGLVAPFEGSFREIGYDAIYAARLAVREINRAGGEEAWRIELIAYDDRGSPEMALQAARNLVVDPAVVAVVGHYRPETIEAAAPVYAAAGLPFITVGGWSAFASTTWALMPPPETLMDAMLEAGTGTEEASPVIWGTLSDAATPPFQGSPEIEGSVNLDAPLVLSFLSPIAAGERLLAWRDAGWTGQVLGDLNFAASAFGTLAGPGARGATFVTPYPFPAHLSDTAGWMAEYQAMGPHVPAPGVYALPTYEAVHSVAEALTVAWGARPRRGWEPVSREDVAATLGQVARSGRLGRIAWDEQHRWGGAPLYVYRWTAQGPELIDIVKPSAGALP
jgi:ABC-type branched-subunit amino acid transport system substrate-binding protein